MPGVASGAELSLQSPRGGLLSRTNLLTRDNNSSSSTNSTSSNGPPNHITFTLSITRSKHIKMKQYKARSILITTPPQLCPPNSRINHSRHPPLATAPANTKLTVQPVVSR